MRRHRVPILLPRRIFPADLADHHSCLLADLHGRLSQQVPRSTLLHHQAVVSLAASSVTCIQYVHRPLGVTGAMLQLLQYDVLLFAAALENMQDDADHTDQRGQMDVRDATGHRVRLSEQKAFLAHTQ